MILEDCIMLARTVPEPSKKYGVKVCSVVYSPELQQLIRVYPLMLNEQMRQRHVFRLELERNHLDSRRESYKKKDFTPTGKEVSKAELKGIFETLVADDLVNLNNQKASLGIIKLMPGSYTLEMRSKANTPDPDQLCLFASLDLSSGQLKTGQDYKHIPYIFASRLGKQKAIQIREWGIYRLLEKKNGKLSNDEIQKLFNNNIVYLIVGNLNGCRSVWIACSFYTFKEDTQQRLFQ
jgi:hypothetical protein